MNWSGTCAAVIPCFNEESTIGELVGEVHKHLPTVIVADDGSIDQTAARASALGAQLVRLGRNQGKGTALKTGLSAAVRQGFDWALTMDGDGQHYPRDIPAFWRCAQETGARLVVGNRMHNPSAIPWLRRHVNRWMSSQLSRRAGCDLPDTQCGFRLIHLATWATLPLCTEHFEVESETLMAFLAAGHPVRFVPVQVGSQGRRSHIHPVADAWRWWKWWRGLAVRGYARLSMHIVAALCVAGAFGCTGIQRRLLYHPRIEPPDVMDRLAESKGLGWWENSDGANIGWKLIAFNRPAEGEVLITHGNGGCAIDRVDFTDQICETAAITVTAAQNVCGSSHWLCIELFTTKVPNFGKRFWSFGRRAERTQSHATDQWAGGLSEHNPILLCSLGWCWSCPARAVPHRKSSESWRFHRSASSSTLITNVD